MEKAILRKKVLVPTLLGAAVILGVTLYLSTSELPKAEPWKEEVTRGEYLEDFILNETDNAFHDYVIAARLMEYIEYPERPRIPPTRPRRISPTRRLGTREHGGAQKEHEAELKEYRAALKKHEEISGEFDKLYDTEERQSITEVSDAVRAHIKDNEQVLNMVRKANLKEKCVVPETTSPSDRFPYLARFRHLARLFLAEGRIREIDNNVNAALDNYIDVLMFGQKSPRAGSLLHGLVSIAIDSYATDALQQIIPRLDETQLERAVTELERADEISPPYSEFIQVECEQLVKIGDYVTRKRGNARSMEMLFESKKEEDSYYRLLTNLRLNKEWIYLSWNTDRISNNLSEFSEKAVEYANLPYNSPEEEGLRRYLFAEEEGLVYRDKVIAVLAPPLERAKEAFARRDTYIRGTMLRAAVELYCQTYGEYPKDLDALVEHDIIKEIPVDPYSNRPFSYIDGAVYSFGYDRDDDKAAVNTREKDEEGRRMLRGDGDMVF
jgi:hypothetical protein